MPIYIRDTYEVQLSKSNLNDEEEERWIAEIVDENFRSIELSSVSALFLNGMIIERTDYEWETISYINDIRDYLEYSWRNIDEYDDKSRSYNSAIKSMYRSLKSILKETNEYLPHPSFSDIYYDFEDFAEISLYTITKNSQNDFDERLEIDKLSKPIDPKNLKIPTQPRSPLKKSIFFGKILPFLLDPWKYYKVKNEVQYKLDQYYKELEVIQHCRLEYEKYQNKINDIKKRHEVLKNNELEKNTEIFNKFKEEIKSEVEFIENKSPTYRIEQEICYDLVSSNLYPLLFLKEVFCKYIEDSSTLIIDYLLPKLEDIINYKEVKYIKSKEEYKISYISEKEHKSLYDDVLYQIALRTLSEVIMRNTYKNFVFNGKVRINNPANGKIEDRCILSIQVSREEFIKVDIKNVVPKTCFKQLKGIGSSQLHSITAIRPIQIINHEDKRFTSHYDVAHTLDEGVNIAAMDWLDFEHLVRELFEEEFRSEGGEVKITRASRDYGVDAVIFDPHPIRGGKLVIQAKRYTNTVEVSAVRDLYGTVMNEGAMKGILVTTSDYGPDAYSFANGKPLTLLNGGELLNLLSKHGHKARIDIKEAKQLRQNQ